MVIRTEATLALYCPHCGKLYMHHFTRFSLSGTVRCELLCSCGQIQATLASVNRRQYLLTIPCVLCGTSHKVFLDARRFWQAEAHKLYCPEETVELGLFGDRRIIEETFANHKHEFDRLLAEDYDGESIDNPQVMFEIFNRVYDLAEQGKIVCRCGLPNIDAEMLSDTIELRCLQCGSRQIVPAATEADLDEVKSWRRIHLIPELRTGHK